MMLSLAQLLERFEAKIKRKLELCVANTQYTNNSPPKTLRKHAFQLTQMLTQSVYQPCRFGVVVIQLQTEHKLSITMSAMLFSLLLVSELPSKVSRHRGQARNQSPNRTIYAYFAEAPDPRDTQNRGKDLKLFMELWAAAGWSPDVVTDADARMHPSHDLLLSRGFRTRERWMICSCGSRESAKHRQHGSACHC